MEDEIFSCTSFLFLHGKKILLYPECKSNAKASGKIISYLHPWNEVAELASTWGLIIS